MANVREEEETEQMELISYYFHLGYEYEVILEFLNQYHDIKLSMRSLTLFRQGFFGVPGPGGGFNSKAPPPLHKFESIDAIVMKLRG